MRRGRRTTIRTAVNRQAILEALAAGGTVAEAAKHAGVGRSSIFEWRAADASFAAEYEDAFDSGSDRYEMEARRRAFNGSDVLLMFLMRQRSPARFNKRMLGDDPDAMPTAAVESRGMIYPVEARQLDVRRVLTDRTNLIKPEATTIDTTANNDEEAVA